MLGGGLGMIICVGQLRFPELGKIVPLLTRPLFFISGLFFSLNDIPSQYHHYLLWNPILHAIELIRNACYPGYNADSLSMGYLAIHRFGDGFLWPGHVSPRLEADGGIMIQLQNVTKSYPTKFGRQYVIRNVSCTLPTGRNIAILGSQWCRKIDTVAVARRDRLSRSGRDYHRPADFLAFRAFFRLSGQHDRPGKLPFCLPNPWRIQL